MSLLLNKKLNNTPLINLLAEFLLFPKTIIIIIKNLKKQSFNKTLCLMPKNLENIF